MEYKNFVITADTTCDLPQRVVEELELRLLPVCCTIGGEDFTSGDPQVLKRFFDRLRAGEMATTSQATPQQAQELFEPILKEGKQILHISFSSGLSGTAGSVQIAAGILNELYGEDSVIVVDSLCASVGEALLIQRAFAMKEEGKSREEIRQWLEQNKNQVVHLILVDDLDHLYRGGRINKATAVVGGALGIKPLLHMDLEGKLNTYAKERGRRKALQSMAQEMAKRTVGYQNPIAYICHGDCEEDANLLADLVHQKTGVGQVMVTSIGATIGAHTGPGVIGLVFLGNPK